MSFFKKEKPAKPPLQTLLEQVQEIHAQLMTLAKDESLQPNKEDLITLKQIQRGFDTSWQIASCVEERLKDRRSQPAE